MKALWQTLTLSFLRRHSLHYLLLFVCIFVGVTGFAAVQVVNQSLKHSFSQSLQTMVNQGWIAIWNEQNLLPSSLYSSLVRHPSIKRVLPVREITVVDEATQRNMQLLFTDFLEVMYAQGPEQSLHVPASTESNPTPTVAPFWHHDASLGQTHTWNVIYKGQRRTIESHLAPTPQPAGSRLTQDLSQSYLWWEQSDHVSRYEIELIPSADLKQLQTEISGDWQWGKTEERLAQSQRLLQSFSLNLTCLSLVSFLVSFFLIYLSLSLALVQRQKDLHLLTLLGCSPRQLKFYLLLESLGVSVVASTAGWLMGHALARPMLDLAAQSVSQMYAPVTATAHWSWSLWLICAAVGCVATGSALLRPLQQLQPQRFANYLRQDSSEQSFENQKTTSMGRPLIWILGLSLCHTLTSFQAPWWSFGTCLFAVLIVVDLIPWLMNQGLPLLIKQLPKAYFTQLSTLHLYPFRYTQVLGALVVSFSLTFAVIDLTASFKTSVLHWIDDQFGSDLYVSTADNRYNQTQSSLPAEAYALLKDHPAASSAYGIHRHWLYYQGQRPLLSITQTSAFLKNFKNLKSLPAVTPSNALPVYVSDNFLIRYDHQVGDTLTLKSDQGQMLNLHIVDRFRDFANEFGHVVLDHAHTQSVLHHKLPQLFHMNLKPNMDLPETLKSLQEQLKAYDLDLLSHRDLKILIEDLLTQTFLLANALKWITFVIALTGLVVNRMILFRLERRSMTLLQTLGMNRRQGLILRLFDQWTLATLATLLAAGGGALLLWCLIYGVQKYFFSWILVLEIHPEHWLYAWLLMLLAATLASFWGERQSASQSPARELHYE